MTHTKSPSGFQNNDKSLADASRRRRSKLDLGRSSNIKGVQERVSLEHACFFARLRRNHTDGGVAISPRNARTSSLEKIADGFHGNFAFVRR